MTDNRGTAALATLDPRVVKGVYSVTKLVHDAVINSEYDPHLLYNAIPWDDCVTLRDILTRRWRVEVTATTHDGMTATQIGRRLPELWVGNYLFNRRQWTDALTYLDPVTRLAIGGLSITGLPFALDDEPFAVWYANLIEDERGYRESGTSTLNHLRYRAVKPVLEYYERLVLREATRILVQSSHTKELTVAYHGISPERIEVLPVGVDTRTFAPDAGATDDNNVAFVGRLNDPRKNVHFLLEAFAQVRESVPDASLTLVGADPPQRHVNKIEALGLEDAVNTPGRVPEVVPYLQRASVFAFPSQYEGFGIAGLEALACGTPVVSTRCGGPEDFIRDGETGYLTDIGDVDTFADRLCTLLTDTERRRAFGEAARELAVEQFDTALIADRLRAVFRDVATR